MNILTTNCLGGFIYRDVLQTQFKNPFIWTGCLCDFAEFIQNFDSIDFSNIEIVSSNGKHDGIMQYVIDSKYKFRNKHVKFSATDVIPRKHTSNIAVDVYVNKPWEYVYNNYVKRVKRMYLEKHKCVIIYEPGMSELQYHNIAQSCKNTNTPCLFLTDKYKENSDIITTVYQECLNPVGWQIELLKKHSQTIKNFIYSHE